MIICNSNNLATKVDIDAVIAGAAPKGQFQIDTAFGRVVIQTNQPLPLEGPQQLQLLAKNLYLHQKLLPLPLIHQEYLLHLRLMQHRLRLMRHIHQSRSIW